MATATQSATVLYSSESVTDISADKRKAQTEKQAAPLSAPSAPVASGAALSGTQTLGSKSNPEGSCGEAQSSRICFLKADAGVWSSPANCPGCRQMDPHGPGTWISCLSGEVSHVPLWFLHLCMVILLCWALEGAY